MSGEYITEGEFGRTMALLEKMNDGLHEQVGALSEQLDRGVVVITGRQDLANGRTNKNEQAVVAATEQIEAIAEQVKEVQATVTHIDQEGCSKGLQHERMIAAVARAAGVPEAGEAQDVDPQKWTGKQKAGLAGFAALVAVASPIILKLIELASAWIQHAWVGK